MSKNFELLREEGRAQELFELQTSESTAVSPVPVIPLSGTPALEVEGMARIEVMKLVQRLFLSSESRGPRKVCFIGTEPGNGCSWICAHVAEILASQVPASVCALDCDLQAPSLHHEFKVENHYGLGDALIGNGSIRQYARQLSRSNLWLLSAGSQSEDPLSPSNLARMQQRIAELQAEFDYILIDTPPLSVSNQAATLGAWSDGVALVLKANSSRREQARRVLQELQAANVPVLGAVLNQRTFPIPDKIYSWL
jgi:polysaccharide biosynthesis transport protein